MGKRKAVQPRPEDRPKDLDELLDLATQILIEEGNEGTQDELREAAFLVVRSIDRVARDLGWESANPEFTARIQREMRAREVAQEDLEEDLEKPATH